MANGDKPPGGVSVSITAPTFSTGISILCHDTDEADLAAKEVAEAVEKVKSKYEKV